MPRVLMGSRMRSKHPRTVAGIPGIDRCLRKESLDIWLLGFCLSGGRMADPAREVHEKESRQPRNRLITNEKKI